MCDCIVDRHAHFDTNVIANIDILDQLSSRYTNSRTFVSADERHLHCKRPITLEGVEISVQVSVG
jgi:hypothetical protein